MGKPPLHTSISACLFDGRGCNESLLKQSCENHDGSSDLIQFHDIKVKIEYLQPWKKSLSWLGKTFWSAGEAWPDIGDLPFFTKVRHSSLVIPGLKLASQ